MPHLKYCSSRPHGRERGAIRGQLCTVVWLFPSLSLSICSTTFTFYCHHHSLFIFLAVVIYKELPYRGDRGQPFGMQAGRQAGRGIRSEQIWICNLRTVIITHTNYLLGENWNHHVQTNCELRPATNIITNNSSAALLGVSYLEAHTLSIERESKILHYTEQP